MCSYYCTIVVSLIIHSNSYIDEMMIQIQVGPTLESI